MNAQTVFKKLEGLKRGNLGTITARATAHPDTYPFYDFDQRAGANRANSYRPPHQEPAEFFGQDDWGEHETYRHGINALLLGGYWADYVAKRAALPFDWTEADKKHMLDYWGNSCIACGHKGRLHIDHWIPVSREKANPGTVPHNLVPLCPICNKDKGGRDASEWLLSEFGVELATLIKSEVLEFFLTVRQIGG